MADQSLEDLARQIAGLQDQITVLSRTSQLGNSSIDTGDESSNVSDAVQTAMQTPAALAGLQDALDISNEDLAATKEAVAAAIEAAQEASDAGVAAGELANAAADDALEKAQQALDAAQAAGGGATYSGSAPTASTPGKAGQQWFVWDSNYHVTAYYVYKDDTDKWVQTVLDDGTFGNISAGRITSGFIDAARIAAASLTAAVLAADTITSREIAADAILARNIKAAEITGDKIAARTIAAGNIAAGTITGDEIKANSITATQILANSITANEINLDTLNGKTITGAIYKSAASGTRIEISGTVLAVYSAAQTKPVGGIQAVEDGSFSAIQIINSYSSAGQAGISLGVPRNPGAGSYESARKLNAQVTYGVQAPLLQANMLCSDRDPSRAFPIYSHAATSEPIYVTSDVFQLGSNAGKKVIFGEGGTNSTPSTVVVQADDFRLTDGSSVVRKVSVSGSVVHTASVTAGTFGSNLSVSFPAGMFSSPPVLVSNASNSRIMTSTNSTTTTSGSIGIGNWSNGTANGPITVYWVAYAQ